MPRHNFLSAVVFTTTLLACLAISRSAVACMCASIEPDLAYQNAFVVFTGQSQQERW
jgi:hypothetical protein